MLGAFQSKIKDLYRMRKKCDMLRDFCNLHTRVFPLFYAVPQKERLVTSHVRFINKHCYVTRTILGIMT